MLHTKLEVLGHTANENVLASIACTSDKEDEDTSDDDLSDGDDMYQETPDNNANDMIATLLEKIRLWKMPDGNTNKCVGQ